MDSARHEHLFVIALFDSGVGGLSVANALTARVPGAALAFVADQAHVPYGGRAVAEVAGFAEAQTDFLFAQGADAVVMACNLSSAVALATARLRHGADRVFGMVEAGAAAAAGRSTTGRIGVLATVGTVSTGAYPKALAENFGTAQCTQVACPAFVPLVEAGATTGPEAHAAVDEALAPLRRAGCDTVILGCTHYPFLRAALEARGAEFDFVDPAEGLAELLAARLSVGPSVMWTTGQVPRFRTQLAAWCTSEPARVGRLIWRDERLHVDDAGSTT